MGRLLGALAFLCIWTAAAAARADKLRGATGAVVQQTHRATVTLRPGHAEWVARRTFMSTASAVNQAILDIDLPAPTPEGMSPSGAPIALRLFGPKTVDGEILPAIGASDRYHRGAGPDPASALLEAGFPEMRLWVAPLRKDEPRTVEYTLILPVTYDGGRYELAVPPSNELAPVIVPHVEGGSLLVRGAPWPSGEPIRYNAKKGTVLALVPDGTGAIRGGLSVIPIGDHFVTHIRADLAPRLSRAPRDARVVVVLDASRSLSPERSAAAVAAARAYLSHLPDAHVELVTFDREVSRRYGELVPQKQALSDLDDLVLERGNGSELALALAEARKVLGEAPAEATKRIVVFTDGVVRGNLSAGDVDDAIDDELARLHLVVVDASESLALDRDSDGAWASSARKTGGLQWRGAASSKPADRAAMKRTFEHLVRPNQLDEISVSTADWVGADVGCLPWSMVEGTGVNQFVRHDKPLPWLKIQGEMWSAHLEATLPVLDDHTEVSSVFALSAAGLDEIESMELATRAHVVTLQTSLLAGTAKEPPPELFERGSGKSVGVQMGGCGCGIGGRHPGNRKRWLEDRLRPLWMDCGGALHKSTLRIETTGAEIVDVSEPKLSKAAPPHMGKCLRERAWDIELPEMFHDDEPASYDLEARPIFH